MDRIDMDCDATTGAMDLINEAGRTLRAGWGEVSDRLNSLTGRIGRGELGAAYLDGYQRPAAETAAAVDNQCRQPGRLATAGHQCVGIYLSADCEGAANFPSAGPASP